MLIGMPKSPKPAASGAPGKDSPVIFDVTTADFQTQVMEASLATPILVDFWAPWCGPCKQLTPVLEKLVQDAKGVVRLAKVNADENPDLASALRVQSLPTVLAFFGGQPVTGFMGAQPASQIKAIIDQLVKLAAANAPQTIDVPAILKDAAQAMGTGDLIAAQTLYAQILHHHPDHAAAYVGMVRTFLAAGEIEQAEGLVTGAPDEIAKHPDFAAAKTALALAKAAPTSDTQGLEERLKNNPADHQAAIDLAQALFAKGARDQSIEILLRSIKRDRNWGEAAARKQLLQFFEALGPADPLTIAARKSLSSILFS